MSVPTVISAPEIAPIVARYANLTIPEAIELRKASEAGDGAQSRAWHAADDAIRAVLPSAAWAEIEDAIWTATVPSTIRMGEARDAAWSAAVYAAAAHLTRREINPEHYAALTMAWRTLPDHGLPA